MKVETQLMGGTEAEDTVDRSVQSYAKIPVSKQLGQVWRARHKQALKRRQTHSIDEAWAQAVKYYENDQVSRRNHVGSDGSSGHLADRIDPAFSETENLVFANVVSTVPMLYAKNPGVEITSPNEEQKQLCTDSERLINIVFTKKETPGVAAKLKIRRAILSAVLCNLGVIECGWYFKDDISETAASELEELMTQLEKAEKAEEIRNIEGKIMELEERMALSEEPGPFIRYVAPVDLLRDPSSVEEDLSDADWVMIRRHVKTKWLKAKFAKDNSRQSLYEPTHLLSLDNTEGAGILDGDEAAYDAFDPRKSHSELGYASQDEYEESQVCCVWYVWDRVTRRVYLFHDKDWSWPIWVYNDPYKLTTFYPVVPLSFYNSVKGGESKGEVAYYLDQQDAVNLCNTLAHQVRAWAATKLFYNKNRMSRQQFEDIMAQAAYTGIGIDVPEGATLEEMIPRAAEHPAAKQMQLFDKSPLYAAIDRIASTSEVMRGGQFKTNTTNDAVQFYQGAMQNRFDDLVDSVEDFVGQVAYLLLQLCWRNMEGQTVGTLLGAEAGARWTNLDDTQIRAMSVQIVGSSTMKPTGANKRREALEVGQVLGQFAKATPVAAVVTLRMMERAFDGVTIKEEEWQLIQQALGAMMMPQPGMPPQGGPQQASPDAGASGMPPEIKQAFDELVGQGIPPEVALEQIKKVVTNGNAKPN